MKLSINRGVLGYYLGLPPTPTCTVEEPDFSAHSHTVDGRTAPL